MDVSETVFKIVSLIGLSISSSRFREWLIIDGFVTDTHTQKGFTAFRTFIAVAAVVTFDRV